MCPKNDTPPRSSDSPNRGETPGLTNNSLFSLYSEEMNKEGNGSVLFITSDGEHHIFREGELSSGTVPEADERTKDVAAGPDHPYGDDPAQSIFERMQARNKGAF